MASMRGDKVHELALAENRSFTDRQQRSLVSVQLQGSGGACPALPQARCQVQRHADGPGGAWAFPCAAQHPGTHGAQCGVYAGAAAHQIWIHCKAWHVPPGDRDLQGAL